MKIFRVIPKEIITKSLPEFGKTYTIIADFPDLNLKDAIIDIIQGFSNSKLEELVSTWRNSIGKIISVPLDTTDSKTFSLLPM